MTLMVFTPEKANEKLRALKKPRDRLLKIMEEELSAAMENIQALEQAIRTQKSAVLRRVRKLARLETELDEKVYGKLPFPHPDYLNEELNTEVSEEEIEKYTTWQDKTYEFVPYIYDVTDNFVDYLENADFSEAVQIIREAMNNVRRAKKKRFVYDGPDVKLVFGEEP